MKILIQKLSSRKLWLALAGVATGIAMVLGVDASDISTVSGAVVSVASVIAYIIAEGKIDAERAKVAVESVQKAKEAIENTNVIGFSIDSNDD